MTKVAAIIPTLAHVNTEYLKLCVESLRPTFEGQIIVISNGSKVKPDYRDIEGISVHLHTRDQGQCNAVNVVAQNVDADTDYLFVSNDDMFYAPGWNKHLRFDHLVFSPNLVEPTDNAGSAPPFLKFDGGYTIKKFRPRKVSNFITEQVDDWNKRKDNEETGFNLPFFINYDVWRTIGGYDTAYDPWGSNSDTDLQTLINLAGITPMRLRDVLVYHFSNKSGTFDGTHAAEWQKNFDYYTQKFGFNRDQLESDVWYNKRMIPKNYRSIKFEADWMDKYA